MDMDMGGDERAGDTRARRRRRGVGGHAHVTHENARSRRGCRIWPTTSRGALVPKSTGIRIRESNGHTAAPLPAVVLAGCAGARSPRSDAVVDPRRSPPDRPTHMHPRHCRHREEHQTARILSSTVRRHEPADPGTATRFGESLFCAPLAAQVGAPTAAPACWSTFETQVARSPDYPGA